MVSVAQIRPGDSVYLEEGGSLVGAVRTVQPRALVLWIENAGEFSVSEEAIRTAHDRKVLLDFERLEPPLREALAHARDAEVPGL